MSPVMANKSIKEACGASEKDFPPEANKEESSSLSPSFSLWVLSCEDEAILQAQSDKRDNVVST